MDTLSNIHCLGCKKRHESVNVAEIKILSVKGSPRYQGTGICPEGKKWTKILNKKEREILSHLMPEEVPKSEDSEDSISSKIIDLNTENNEIKAPENGENEDILSIFDDSNDEISIVSPPSSASFLKPEDAEDSPYHDEKTVAQDSISSKMQDLTPSFEAPEQGDDDEISSVKGEVVNEIEGLRRDLRSVHRPRRREPEVVDIRPQRRTQDRVYHISGEQAFKYGRHYGYNEASFSGERYKEGISFHFKQSKVHEAFFDDFARGYLEGGENYLLNISNPPSVEQQAESSSLSPKTTAGLAAASIFGAWVASKIKRGG